jgi:DNA-binding XRE family transcriptional regulator
MLSVVANSKVEQARELTTDEWLTDFRKAAWTAAHEGELQSAQCRRRNDDQCARHAGGVTQEELADRAGSSSRYVGSIERGSVVISIITLVQLASALKVEPAELLRLPPRRPAPPMTARLNHLLRSFDSPRLIVCAVDCVVFASSGCGSCRRCRPRCQTKVLPTRWRKREPR